MRKQGYIVIAAVLAIAFTVVLYLISANTPKSQTVNSLPTVPPSSETVTGGQGTQAWDDWGQGTPAPTGGEQPVETPSFAPTLTPSPSPSPTPTSSALRHGDEGAQVQYIQTRLKALGYLTGSADGVFGDATEAALKSFQSVNGLYVDGVAGERTIDKLKSGNAKSKPKDTQKAVADTAKATSVPKKREYTPSEPDKYGYLQLGSRGSAVTRLQKRLIELGYLSGKASGDYDEATRDAVIAFQDRNGEWVDGVAGEDTQTKLFSDKALAASRD